MEYILITKTDSKEFENEINFKLKESWKLHGNTNTFAIHNDGVCYTQAMIRERKPLKHIKLDKNLSVEEILASWNL